MSRTAMAMVAAAVVWSAGWAGATEHGTLTIVGRGSGPAKVIGKDGAVEKVAPESMELLNRPQAVAPAPHAARPAEPAVVEVSAEDAAAAVRAEEEAKQAEKEAKQAEEAVEARRRAEEERRKTEEKEFHRYADKDYTYGPGSATREDQTGKVVEQKRGGRRAAGASAGPQNVRVGGETRIRVNVRE